MPFTPQEIEANSDALLQALAAHGVTPETALAEGRERNHPGLAALAKAGIDPSLTLDEVLQSALLERGRERARPRYQQALERAQRYGYTALADRIENMVEADAQRHMRRGMRRGGPAGPSDAAGPVMAPPLPMSGRGGIGSDAIASPPPVGAVPARPGSPASMPPPPLPTGVDYSTTPGRASPLAVLGSMPRADLMAPSGPQSPPPSMLPTLSGVENRPQTPIPQLLPAVQPPEETMPAPPLPTVGALNPMLPTLAGGPRRNAMERAIENASSGIDWSRERTLAVAPSRSEQPITDRLGGGPIMGGAENLLRNVARESTGIPAADRAARAFAYGDYTGGAINAATAVAPFVAGPVAGVVGRGLTSQPVQAVGRTLARPAVGAPLATAGAVTATTAQTQQPQPGEVDTLAMLREQRAAAEQARAAAVASRDKSTTDRDDEAKGRGGRAAGRGPNYDRLTGEIQRYASEIQSQADEIKRIDAAITRELYERSPQGRADAGRVTEAERVLQQKLADIRLPFHEAAPNWLQNVQPALPAILGFGTALAMRSPGAVGNRLASRRWSSATEAGLAPNAAPATVQLNADLARNAARNYPAPRNYLSTYAAPVTIGGAEGLISTNLPEGYNLFLPALNQARIAWQEYLDRLPAHEVYNAERQRVQALIGSMPQNNPWREAASDYFSSRAFPLRTMVGVAEGAGGAALGTTLGGLPAPSAARIGTLRAETTALERLAGRQGSQPPNPPPNPPPPLPNSALPAQLPEGATWNPRTQRWQGPPVPGQPGRPFVAGQPPPRSQRGGP